MASISFAGLASGIDSQAIIDSSVASARASRVTPQQKKLGDLQETNSALTTLGNKLGTLRTALDQFTSVAGGGVSKTGTSSRESVVGATVANSAANGSYDITVNALAKNHTYSFDQTYSSTKSAIQSSGFVGPEDISFTIGTGSSAENVTVTVTDSSYTISNFVTDFNKASSKAKASLINTGTAANPAYKIVLSSNYEGVAQGSITRTALGAGLTDLAAYSESAAADSSVTISGIGTVVRSTNSISDVISGLTFNLVSQGSASIKIAEDPATTTSRVQDFITAYNDLVSFIKENNAITRDESGKEVKNTFGPLASTRTDDGVLQALRLNIAGAKSDAGSTVKILSDIGITSERTGTLKFDQKKLQSALSSEPTAVDEVLQSFADSVALSNGTIYQYTKFSGLIDTSVNSNNTMITELNRRINDAEQQIARMADSIKQRYARLEGLMSQMQQQQNSLAGALGTK